LLRAQRRWQARARRLGRERRQRGRARQAHELARDLEVLVFAAQALELQAEQAAERRAALGVALAQHAPRGVAQQMRQRAGGRCCEPVPRGPVSSSPVVASISSPHTKAAPGSGIRLSMGGLYSSSRLVMHG
jgi:hypothetical protein